MNREIKFRGKNNQGVWIYGHYFKYNETHNVVPDEYSSKPSEYFNVDPETLGQFTGLKDKNGKDIYEGDKVSDDTYVYFANGCFKTTYEGDHQGGNLLSEMRCKYIEVIGNIHE